MSDLRRIMTTMGQRMKNSEVEEMVTEADIAISDGLINVRGETQATTHHNAESLSNMSVFKKLPGSRHPTICEDSSSKRARQRTSSWVKDLIPLLSRFLFVTLLRAGEDEEGDEQPQGREEEVTEGTQGQLQQQEWLLQSGLGELCRVKISKYFNRNFIRGMLIIVYDLISVDVLRLPELILVRVEEGVGVVLECDALQSEGAVSQQSKLGGDKPRFEGSNVMQIIHTQTCEVLHIGGRHQEI